MKNINIIEDIRGNLFLDNYFNHIENQGLTLDEMEERIHWEHELIIGGLGYAQYKLNLCENAIAVFNELMPKITDKSKQKKLDKTFKYLELEQDELGYEIEEAHQAMYYLDSVIDRFDDIRNGSQVINEN
jgi:hypothetical protein